jgi:murein DD-endopeptidase MepM/ murein hydrolase activator NlpD
METAVSAILWVYRSKIQKRGKLPVVSGKKIMALGCVLGLVFFLGIMIQQFLSTPSTAGIPEKNTLAAVRDLPKPDTKHSTQSMPEAEEKISNSPKTSIQKDTLLKKIEPGQTLSNLLEPYLDPTGIHETAQKCNEIFPVTKFRAGQPYKITLSGERMEEFIYEIDSEKMLVMYFPPQGQPTVELQAIAYETVEKTVSGTITSSLFEAVDAQGEGPELAIALAEIFGWDVDFVRDIREGDSFKMLVRERYRDGKFSGYGPILAARFTNQGHTFNAFRFVMDSGGADYYDAKGNSMRKAFLKAPLSFTRISSGYSGSRFHPILKVWRPHRGIDYAAPTGTPIKTVGDGVVSARSYGKAAGRYVKVRHANGYESCYNHMSKYASGTAPGSRVRQGQVIGYVGSTGYATGPHLDFRMKKNGAYINPLKVKSPPALPVPKKYKADFEKEKGRLLALLEDTRKTGIAAVEPHDPEHPQS